MFIGTYLERFAEARDADALIWNDQVTSYGELLETIETWEACLDDALVPGSVVAIEADFSPQTVGILLALIEKSCIVVPLSDTVAARKDDFRRIAEVEAVVSVNEKDEVRIAATETVPEHEHILTLKERGHPGLILFSSGSTGKSKAALHDLQPFLRKYALRRQGWRTINFLLFDHIGGLNTLFHTLSNAGCVITVRDRSPDAICRAIARHRVQVLPTSPTFLNLLLLSEAHQAHDLSSLELVTYGTEPMPQSTLDRFHALFPKVRLLQTYGLSEVGILRSKSKSSLSRWVKIGGEGFETRVVDDLLEIKAESAMIGYLNAPSPFTADGWFKTGDAVEVDGEYLRILGRKSEIINVGGEKVYPAEVESVLLQMSGVNDVTVTGESNAITGQLVKAVVHLSTDEKPSAFRKRMRQFCGDKLAPFKVPQRVVRVSEGLHGDRFKKLRNEYP